MVLGSLAVPKLQYFLTLFKRNVKGVLNNVKKKCNFGTARHPFKQTRKVVNDWTFLVLSYRVFF